MAKLATLIDDFSDGVIGPLWTILSGASHITEAIGRLQLQVKSTDPLAVVESTATYDMADSHVIAHVPSPTGPGSTLEVQSGIFVRVDNNNAAWLYKRGNNIECMKTVAGVQTVVFSTAYNPATHVYWRLRESAGIFYWELSAAGISWTSVFNTATSGLFSVTNLKAGIYAASPLSGEAFFQTLQVESINQGLTLSASGVSTSSGTATITIKYLISGSGISTSVGSAEITIPPLTSHSLAGIGSSASTGSASIVVIPVVVSTLQISASGVSTSDGSAALLLAGQFSASGLSTSNGSASITVTQVSSAPRIYTFEPPIVYDIPRTLPGDPRNRLAKWYNPLPRGRSVLKLSQSTAAIYPLTSLFPEDDLFPLVPSGETIYAIVDTPTTDQMAAAIFTYQGGHIYTVTETEASNLVTAGFSVAVETSGSVIVITPPTDDPLPGSSTLPSLTLLP